MQKYKAYISCLLLTLWCSVQVFDSLHHIHEAHEELCSNATEHFCEPHAEVDICSLCLLVHNAVTKTCDTNIKHIYGTPHTQSVLRLTFGYQQYETTPGVRGPPILV